jgi:hypothetical protein
VFLKEVHKHIVLYWLVILCFCGKQFICGKFVKYIKKEVPSKMCKNSKISAIIRTVTFNQVFIISFFKGSKEAYCSVLSAPGN